jgi:hypothetical protein
VPVIYDDDVMAIPTAPPQALATKPPAAPDQHTRLLARVNTRRTFIPILLTLGVAFPLVGLWWFTRGLDSPLRLAGVAFPVSMFIVGATMLALAVLNMLQVRAMLQQADGSQP